MECDKSFHRALDDSADMAVNCCGSFTEHVLIIMCDRTDEVYRQSLVIVVVCDVANKKRLE